MIVDAAGKKQVFDHYNQLTAGAVGDNISAEASAMQAALTSPGGTTRAAVVGNMYEIDTPGEHDFVDATTYRIVKTEEIQQDGSVGEVREYPTLDITSGNAVPTPSTAGTVTPSASPTPAAATGTQTP